MFLPLTTLRYLYQEMLASINVNNLINFFKNTIYQKQTMVIPLAGLIVLVLSGCAHPRPVLSMSKHKSIFVPSYPNPFSSKTEFENWEKRGYLFVKNLNTKGINLGRINNSTAYEKSETLKKHFKTKINFENQIKQFISNLLPKHVENLNNYIMIIDDVDLVYDTRTFSVINMPTADRLADFKSVDVLSANSFDSAGGFPELISKIRIKFEIYDGEDIVFNGVVQGVWSGYGGTVSQDHPDYLACLIAMRNLVTFVVSQS